MLSRATIRWLQGVSPDNRLNYAAKIFWWSIVGAIVSTIFLCRTWFERILMVISWLAVTLTSMDLIQTSDVRTKEEKR